MAAQDTAARVARYLERRIAWFEEILVELEEVIDAQSDADMEAWGDHQQRRTREMESLTREHAGLLREWRNLEPRTPEQRQWVRRLAARAETLQAEVLERHAQVTQAIEVRMKDRADDLATLRSGQDMLEKYRPAGAPMHDFLDRQA